MIIAYVQISVLPVPVIMAVVGRGEFLLLLFGVVVVGPAMKFNKRPSQLIARNSITIRCKPSICVLQFTLLLLLVIP